MNLRVGEFLNFSCFNIYTSNLAFLYDLARCIILLAKMYNFCSVKCIKILSGNCF